MGNHDCNHRDTEYLTSNGWKKHDKINKNIENVIRTSKLVKYSKKISRKVAEKLGIDYDDPDDVWIDLKIKELAMDIHRAVYGHKK